MRIYLPPAWLSVEAYHYFDDFDDFSEAKIADRFIVVVQVNNDDKSCKPLAFFFLAAVLEDAPARINYFLDADLQRPEERDLFSMLWLRDQ